MLEMIDSAINGLITEITPHLPLMEVITTPRKGVLQLAFLAIAGIIISNLLFIL